jgi:Sulfotransferase family
VDVRVLEIAEKVSPSESFPSVRSNFVLQDGGAVPVETVLDPQIDLYCLDDRSSCALFAELPDGVDPAGTPFFYLTQYQEAKRLFAVPYETLHALADDLPDPSLTVVWSTGRCGSTLLSRALAEIEGVRSLSEPDVLNDILMLRHWEPDRAYDRLLRSCIRLLGRDARTLALKPRGGAVHLAGLVHETFPSAHHLFLHRQLERWMDSMHAGFTPTLPAKRSLPTFLRYLHATAPLLASFGRRPTLPEQYALTWLSVMDGHTAARAAGVPMLDVRYEDLVAAPRDTLQSLLTWCELPTADLDTLLATWAVDSQSGTALARDNRLPVAPLTDADYAAARAIVTAKIQ